ncbi:glycerophosphodiester phosphodiesterase family protein [Maribellus sp. YY47]|uniref:glycerophosphodiester phosphodiesterase family protein n=1 Tax=Maribellus sp. YY47 TaxID=2929486 RepID=UPI0020006E5F|nr:glycerophosphodiester phosphodiesterase family protein [Maribellus sp. YY47]MCK3685560.1 PKD domain-containing protein [Maribellus sp. YY47]
MKRYFLLMCFWIGFGILLQSCQKDDNGGGTGVDDQEEDYELPAPTFTISNPVPCINEEVEFSFTTDASVTQVWKLGDETSSTEKTIKHKYTSEGDFNVNLKLSDGKGGVVSIDTIISVMGKRINDALDELVKETGKVWVCSHRGNTYYGQKIGSVPENSVEAIERAVTAGAQMIEMDVRNSADGAFVMMHDATIDRTTDGAGTVAEMSLSMLKRFKLKAEDGTVTDDQIPTLEEALLAGRGKIFYELDIKKGVDIPTVVHLCDSLHMLDRVVFYRGSSKEKAREVTDVNSQAIVFPYVETVADIDYWSADPRIKLIQVGYGDATASEIVAAAKAKGMASFTSYISDAILYNNFTEVDNIRSMQYQIILTNYVEMLKPYVE